MAAAPTQRGIDVPGDGTPNPSADGESVCRLLFAASAVCFVAVMWSMQYAVLTASPTQLVAGITVSAGTLALGVTPIWFGFNRRVGVLVAVLTLSGWLLAASLRHVPTTGRVWWPDQLMPIVFAFVLVAIGGWLGAVLLAALGLAMVVGQALAGGIPVATATNQTLGPLAFAVAATQVLRYVRHAAAVNAEADREHLAKVAAEKRSTGREAHVRWVDHLLHDEVVHALRAISLSRRLSDREVISSAESALARLEGSQETETSMPQGLSAALRNVVVGDDFAVRFDLQTVVLPDDIVSALIAAAREALRNAKLHSGVAAADVVVRRERHGVRVEISDAGSGFDGEVPHAHFGVSRGIVERMQQVGGSASVTSNRAGTTVVLRWHPHHEAVPAWVDMTGARTVTVAVTATFAVMYVVQATIGIRDAQRPSLAALGTVVLLCAWALAAAAFRTRCLSGAEAVFVAIVAVLVQASGAVALGARHTNPDSYWLAGAAILLVPFILIGRRRRFGPSVMAMVVGVAPVTFVLLQQWDLHRVILLGPAVLVPIGGAAVLLWICAMAERTSQHTLQEREGAAHSATRAWEAELRQLILLERIGGLRDVITPLLRTVAESGVGADADRLRTEALVLEAWVRDSIGGSSARWPDQLKDLVEQLRRRGSAVSLTQAETMTATQLEWVRTGLHALAGLAHTPEQISVTCLPGASEGRLTITVAPYSYGLLLALDRLPATVTQTDDESFVSVRFAHESVRPAEDVLEIRDVRSGSATGAMVQ